MRRTAIYLILVALLLTLTACAVAEPEPTAEATEPTETTEATTEVTTEATTEATEPTVSEAERLYGLGIEALESGDSDAAYEYFEAARAHDETSSFGWLGLAEILIRDYDFEGAETLLTEALEKTGNAPSVAKKLEMLRGESITDSSGRLLRLNGLDEKEGLLFYITYAYLDDGKLGSCTSFDGLGNQTGHVQLEYDDQGREIVDAFFQHGEWIIRRREYDYDALGNITHERQYTPEGTLDKSIISTYNEHNQKIRAEQYNAEGLELIYHYSYNSMGLLERWDTCEKDDSLMLYALYFYDEDGNCVEIQHCEPDGTIFMREVVSYDENGKMLKREYFDGAGNLTQFFDYD